MLIRAGYRITLQCVAPTAIHTLLNVHPDRVQDLQSPDVVQVSPTAPTTVVSDAFGNKMVRVLAPVGETTFSNEFVIRDSGLHDEAAPHARQVPIEELPTEVLTYLLPSRYCESDVLSDLAWANFTGLQGWDCAKAACKFAHESLRFDYQRASSWRSANDGLRDRVGVCRDFTHLAIALTRAMNIPARYCTGYLGDIGVPLADSPMDFSAWYEVYLENRWWSFDARHNAQRIGRIVMARGRDAADVAITHAFGPARLMEFTVLTDEMEEPAGAASSAQASPDASASRYAAAR